MSLLEENTYEPKVLARVYRILLLDAQAEQRWVTLVEDRNTEYAKYLTPPDTASGRMVWERAIHSGQIMDTVIRLNEKWHEIIESFVSEAVSSRQAKRIVH